MMRRSDGALPTSPQRVVSIASDSHHSSVCTEIYRESSMHAHMEHVAEHKEPQARAPHPGTDGYDNLPQFPATFPLPFRRTIRRQELHQIVPLAETTIYAMEQRGEFPRRFALTVRCVVWDLEEVEAWVAARKQASRSGDAAKSTGPDVRQRKSRPVRNTSAR